MRVHRCPKGTVHCRGTGQTHICEDPNRYGFDDGQAHAEAQSAQVESRLENLITAGGKFPNAKAYADAAIELVQLKTDAVRRLVEKVRALPPHQKKALSIAAQFFVTVLENELAKRTGVKRRKRTKKP